MTDSARHAARDASLPEGWGWGLYAGDDWLGWTTNHESAEAYARAVAWFLGTVRIVPQEEP